MSTPPKWKRVLISGSNLEVNHLTSSTDLDPYLFPNTPQQLIFASDPTHNPSGGGHFQLTSSVDNTHVSAANPRLRISHTSLNVPGGQVSASVLSPPEVNPTAQTPQIQFPFVFKNNPHGGFENTSSIAYLPLLEFFGFQSSSVQQDIQSGSAVEFPFSQSAPFPGDDENIFGTPPLTFTGSYTSQSQLTYIDTSNGDYMEWDRSVPVGAGVTASFSIPIVFTGSLFTLTNAIQATLRRYEPGLYTTDYQDVSFSRPLSQIIGTGGPQFNDNPNPGATGSFSGSFEVTSLSNNPILEGERWQLRISADNGYSIGYRYNKDPNFDGTVGSYEFKISGSTAQSFGEEVHGNLSGSFAGAMYGGYSGSITNITLNDIPDSQGLTRGSGLLFRKIGGTNNVFTGDAETTMSLRLSPQDTSGDGGGVNKSGLEIPALLDSYFSGQQTIGGNTTVQLATGFAGTGLQHAGSNREQLGVELASSDPGINTSGGGGADMRLANTLVGVGLSGSFGGLADGSASINLNPSQSGLQALTSGPGTGLGLKSELAGNGLNYGAGVLNLDTNLIVTGSGSITLRAAGGPYNLQVGQNFGQPFSTEGNSQTILYNNNPVESNAVLVLRTTQPDAITFKDNVLVKGNFRVLDSSNVVSIHADKFQTTDHFITLNSGSFATTPFSNDIGGFIIQTGSAAGQASGSALFYMDGNSISIGGQTFTEAGWGLTRGKVPWDARTPIPPFDSNFPSVGRITGSDYAASISNVRLSAGPSVSSGDPQDISTAYTFYDHQNLDSLGSWFIDTGSNPTGGESNVYIYGFFD